MTGIVRTSLLSLALLGTLATPTVASAREALPPAGHASTTSAYSEPDAALGGIPLAVYVSRHQGLRLGPTGV